MPTNIATFIAELRRRRVFRVAAFYGGIAFVKIRIIDAAETAKSHHKSHFTGYGPDTGFRLSTGTRYI